MRYGVCTEPKNLGIAKECGYDFIEYQLRELDGMSDRDVEGIARDCESLGIRVEAMNCMLPPRFRLTGPGADLAPIREYLMKNVPRAAALGCRTIVFGSAPSRDMPPDFSDRIGAMGQLVEYLHMASDICQGQGVVIAIEPLGGKNIVAYLAEGHHLLSLAGRENVRLLADYYAMSVSLEPCEAMDAYAREFAHLHFASPAQKFPREGDGYDYAPFFAAIRRAGYDRRISVEAGLSGDMREEYRLTLALMRRHLD